MSAKTPLLFALSAALTLSACTNLSHNAGQIPEHTTASSILWKRTTAEYPAITRQIYLLAEKRLRYLHQQALLPNSWAVVLDIDETVLDNSAYDMQRASQGLSWSHDSWSAWIEKREAPAIPGAVAFLRQVKKLGGQIAFVTNRDEATRVATLDNLAACGLPFDYLLTMQGGKADKSKRWRWLADHESLNIIMWIGDQTSDLPILKQCQSPPVSDLFFEDSDAAGVTPLSTQFGEALKYPLEPGLHQSIVNCAGSYYFVLPNPIYGGWGKNIWR